MTTCLVLGGGNTLHADLARYTGPIDGVVTVNDALTEWPYRVDAAVSLHPRYFELKGWRAKRDENGYAPAERYFGHPEAKRLVHKGGMFPELEFTPYRFPGQDKTGSSGLFGAKVALIDLGFDLVVLCGVPMTPTPHFWDVTREDWKAAEGFRHQWLTVPQEYRDRMRSMSGWTRVLLGAPETKGG